MTTDRARKSKVRARMARTGESYTAALRHLRSAEGDDVPTTDTTPIIPTASTLRLAVAQTTPRSDPADAAGIRAAGQEVRALMREARAQGADLIQLTEATLCFPDKRLLSRSPDEITEADWSRFAGQALDEQLERIRGLARELGLRTVIGAQTWADAPADAPWRSPWLRGAGLPSADGHAPADPGPAAGASADDQPAPAAPARPRTSMLVIGPDGSIEARYDERRLSRTKDAVLYARGREQVTIDAGGLRLGLASGLDVLFGDVFLGYEDAGADAVLLSCQASGDPDDDYGLVISALAAARQHGLAVGWAAPTTAAAHAASGVIGPDGRWAATCPAQPRPAVVVHEIGRRAEGGPRRWRREMVDAG